MTRLAPGLSEAEAKQFYDRYGRKLDWSDAFEGRAKSRAWSLLGAQSGERIVELGIGCGHHLVNATGKVGPTGLVVGVDISETMLSLSHGKAPEARLVRCSGARLPLASDTFDAAFTSYALDLLPLPVVDQALGELFRVLRAGGRLVLCGLTEGATLFERSVMGLWKSIHRINPARVGGCRPLVLGPHVEAAGFTIELREHVGQLGTPSEVLRARKPS